MRLFPTPPYRDVQELLDRAGEGEYGERELESTLRDIRRANFFGLGTWVVKHHLERLLHGWPPGEPVRMLDLATGSADIPQAICSWGLREGLDIRFVATDISTPILRVAAQRIARAGLADRISVLACDALRPPFEDGSFDIVTCSLAFHHLTPCQATSVLREMARMARRGFIVNDIYRSQGAWYMAMALSRVMTANRLTRHDGPASVMRAFTPVEMRRLSKQAGVAAKIYRHPFWRVGVVYDGR